MKRCTLIFMISIWVCFSCSQGGGSGPKPGEDSGTGSGDISTADTSDKTCTPGQMRCVDNDQAEICVDGIFVPTKCPEGSVCDGDECKTLVCVPGESTCTNSTTVDTCNSRGTGYESTTCEGQQVCSMGQCVEGCMPGSTWCVNNTVYRCDDNGQEVKDKECKEAQQEVCLGGACLTQCEQYDLKRSYIGCRYIAADLPNDVTADDNIFAFAFSNPSETQEAQVKISYPTGKIQTVTIQPQSVGTHALPIPRTMMVRGSGISHLGFLIESTSPIVAFMFNPLEKYDDPAKPDITVATNDASLLLPDAVLGTRYWAMTWSDPGQFSGPPYVTIVALEDDTELLVTPTEDILMPQEPYVLPAHEESTIALKARDVLNLESVGGDLTGTFIAANRPVASFSGNTCARVPDMGRFCDHIETQLPPEETWGQNFIVSKFTDRGGESDYFRVLAQQDSAALSFDPPRTNVPLLNRGEFYEFESKTHFTLTADQPVLLGQFMASQNMTDASGPFGKDEPPWTDNFCPDEDVGGGTCWGDPALVLVPPVEQLRSDYIFLVPNTYKYNFVNIAFDAATTIEVNGVEQDTAAATPVGSSDHLVLTLPTQPGYYTLKSSHPVAVIVYGFDHNISYAYNAGLNFTILQQSMVP